MSKNVNVRFFVPVLAALLMMFITFIESQIFLHIYGTGNIPATLFLVTVFFTFVLYSLCLSRFLNWLDK
ncbi:MAG: hypothetical protein COV30_01540 [Candidatus Yanofskybacteria bacterium CG10_big_fil_rev_8_21_14_0_10_37_15]|uniref:Uncharacterized protein n=1 Tax=Candidatus Yanofskybacteria bacterium CG10_big_fil_rev_8_21_14_0_10_37_15 TaxID=1975097 RepID=A0A2H0R7R0_9BACT|nr:MAG: hypothetical protein COV30_01540 [Candidatus Yanofskybacteria bacterium CG10_big_fil_rev_8_21_14_0_10_37_15]